ncbi:hypothetical protein ACFY3M_51160 [Streptomyces mirabilis]|uniref:hypothetical protein n=1 Tax=Streptomyces mirabilis TaxID=68239 RepID=UPI0036A17B86
MSREPTAKNPASADASSVADATLSAPDPAISTWASRSSRVTRSGGHGHRQPGHQR